MTLRGSTFAFAAAIVLKLSDRRDLVLRVALRKADDPTKPNIPTYFREAAGQMLAMLW